MTAALVDRWLPWLLAASAAALLYPIARLRDRGTSLCIVVYLGTYALTTLVGAVLFSSGRWSELVVDWGLDTSVIWVWRSGTYWALVFAPTIVVPAIVLSSARLLEQREADGFTTSQDTMPFGPSLVVTSALVAYCAYQLHGRLHQIDWAAFDGDFHRWMALRQETKRSLSHVFFGILYTTLPCLSFAFLCEAARRGAWRWRLLFAATVVAVLVLSLALLHKSTIVLYVAVLLVAIIEVKQWPLWSLLAALLAAALAVTAMQAVVADRWPAIAVVRLLAFRLGVTPEYYVNLYPDRLPYLGPDLALNVFGLAAPPRDAIDVIRFMYPNAATLGQAAAAAHVRAYAQGGLPVSLVTTVVLGLAVACVIRARRRVRGPMSFALYAQSLCFLYYLTHTTIVDALLGSAGLLYAPLGLVLVEAWRRIRGGTA